jgi:hypothetical protein
MVREILSASRQKIPRGVGLNECRYMLLIYQAPDEIRAKKGSQKIEKEEKEDKEKYPLKAVV